MACFLHQPRMQGVPLGPAIAVVAVLLEEAREGVWRAVRVGTRDCVDDIRGGKEGEGEVEATAVGFVCWSWVVGRVSVGRIAATMWS